MTRKRFFVEEVKSEKQVFDLPGPLSHQLESVLRVRKGESIELLDREGAFWECSITEIRKGKVTVSVVGRLDRPERESPLDLTLGVAIARPDTMDLVVRQATEMGVMRLAVFRSARSQYGIAGKQAEKKKERWLKIAREAVCQCGRTRPLEIEVFDNLDHFLDSTAGAPEGTLKIFGLESGQGSGPGSLANEVGPGVHRVLGVIGPEGGWNGLEISAFIGAGFKAVSLGPRILRLETAAVALVSSIQLLWGDMGTSFAK